MSKDKPLTDRQQVFVNNCARGSSQTDAYIDAGYKSRGASARAEASRLITKDNIKQAIQAKRAEIQAKQDITRDEVIANARWQVDFGKDKARADAVRAGNE